MKKTQSEAAVFFLVLTLISSVGDTVFLVGIPLFLYLDGGGAILDTTYVSFLIAISILLSRRLILTLNKRNPLLITGVGEIAMAFIEILLLLIFHFLWASKWLVLLFVLPLAMVYNMYAPAKFFKLQDYFFSNETFYFTAWQSAMQRAGMFVGIAMAGLFATRWGLFGVVMTDCISFLAYGIPLLWFYLAHQRMRSRDVVAGKSHMTRSSQGPGDVPTAFLPLAMVLITLAGLFQTWEQASGIAVASKVSSLSADQVSLLRASLGGLGLVLGLVISKQWRRIVFHLWVWTLSLLTIGVVILSTMNVDSAVLLLFLSGGVLSCLNLPMQRAIYKTAETHGNDYTALTTKQWILRPFVSLSLIPVGVLIDSEYFSAFNALGIAGLSILVFGLAGGYFIYRSLRVAIVK